LRRIRDQLRGRLRKKSQLKGRQPDAASMAEVQTLIGTAPHRRDLLIENLHKLNDLYRGLHDRHLVALSRQMNIPMAEVFEVATFYHHFEVLRDGQEAARLTVRVCDGLACELKGARDLLARLPALLGSDVRVIAAPCVGRCEQAPVAVVGQAPVVCANAGNIQAAASHGANAHPAPPDDGNFDPAATGASPVTRSPTEVSPHTWAACHRARSIQAPRA
jgi:formate dehydrogenase